MSTVSDETAIRNIAANVTRLRGERSKYWLAKACGTYPSSIGMIESAKTMPGAGLLSRIAEALGVTTDDLLRDPRKKLSKTG